MAPPPLPLSPALNVLPSNQNAVNHTAPAMVSPGFGGVVSTAAQPGDNTGVGTGPGPLRHPRPLTAADLHLQLEKEQEAVVSSLGCRGYTSSNQRLQVNRLTRELSMLRAAQNASVVSNSSSTSAGFPDTGDINANHMLSGPSHPAPSQRRHHRSSSSTSTRSNTAASTSTAWTTGAIAGSVSGATPSSTADRTRVSVGRHESNPQSLSRQNSITSSRRSGASSPALTSSNPSLHQPADYFPSGHSQRPSVSLQRDPSGTRVISGSSHELDRHPSTSSATSIPTTGRYEETAYHRHELEAVKRENEALKRKIRELERTLRERRQSDASTSARPRSESVSTTASMSMNASRRDSIVLPVRGREEKEGEREEVVRVGESATSAGLR